MKSIRWMRCLAGALLSLQAAVAGASGHIVEIAWSPQGSFEHRASVAAGKFVEVCGALRVGEPLRWQFEATAPLDFNIHYHAGKDVHYAAKQAQVRQAASVLRVQAPQDHCWMWTNRGSAPVELTLVLTR